MPRGRSDRGGFLPVGINAPSCRGVYRVPLFHLSVGMCVRVCDIEFVVFTDCDSCTRPISTNPVSMEASKHGPTRETCDLRVVSTCSRLPGCCTFRDVFWVG